MRGIFLSPPAFWEKEGRLARLLTPLGALYGGLAARRAHRPPRFRPPIPVLCIGNATLGGSGKTPLALDLAARLIARGRHPAFLSRGYGGRAARYPLRVDPARHEARDVGDEPLLLARSAPTFVDPDRVRGARAALAAGADVLVMDDGLQNPSLAKTASLLVIDGPAGFGNARPFPAGPLREPLSTLWPRLQGIVLLGPPLPGLSSLLPPTLPCFRAHLVPGPAMAALAGRRVFAVAGIGRPAKFRESLLAAGAEIAGFLDFPDHHPFSPADEVKIFTAARLARAEPVTTAKDWVRLSPSARARITAADIALRWEDEGAIEAWLESALHG
jgi:tetraacyldisaccharide 4'-kinase